MGSASRTTLLAGLLLGAGASFLALARETPRLAGPASPSAPRRAPAPRDRARGPVIEEPEVNLALRLGELAWMPGSTEALRLWARLPAEERRESLLRIAFEPGPKNARAVAFALLVTTGNEADRRSLIDLSRSEPDAEIRRAAIHVLAAGGAEAIAALAQVATTDPDGAAAEAAVHALAAAGVAEAHEALERALRMAAGDPRRREAVYRALMGERPGGFPGDLPWFSACFTDCRPVHSDPGRPEALARVARLVATESDPRLRAGAAAALASIDEPAAREALVEMWARSPAAEREGIRRAILTAPRPALLEALILRTPDVDDASERRQVAIAARKTAVPGHRPFLEEWLRREEDPGVRVCLSELLASWTAGDVRR